MEGSVRHSAPQSVLNVPQFWAADIWLLMRIIWLRRVLLYHTFGPRELYYSAEFGWLGPCLIFAAPGFKTAQDKAVSVLFHLRRDFRLRRVFLDLSRAFAEYK